MADENDISRVAIVIRPEPSDEGLLSVDDAMSQVLDAIALLKAAKPERFADFEYKWKLERATTNSPFTVYAVAEAVDPRRPVIDAVAVTKHVAAEGLRQLLRGEGVPAWMGRETLVTAGRMFGRTLNGVADTSIDFVGHGEPIGITKPSAGRALEVIGLADPYLLAVTDQPKRVVYGQLSGRLGDATTMYNKPAFVLITSQYGDVTCRVPPRIEEEMQWARVTDVWRHKPIAVTGRLHYSEQGILRYIDVEAVEERSVRSVPLEEVRDASFTEGLEPVEYLRRLHGDDGG